MKLIINTTNLSKGGGIQVAHSFINECITFPNHEYHVFLCKQLSLQINKFQFPDNFHFYDFPLQPTPFLKGRKVIKKLKLLEKAIEPDCVFSVFGPTYWTPTSPHLLGYAIPHFIYPESPFFKIVNIQSKIKWKLMKTVKEYYFLRNAKFFHVETEDSKIRLSKYLKCPLENIFSVSNTYNSIYQHQHTPFKNLLPKKGENEFRLISLTAYYPHKNLVILNKLIPSLIEREMSNIKFILTIDGDIFDTVFSDIAKSQIINIGPVPIAYCPQLYTECDAMFLPSLLECFSANYPEAMKMNKPILTSDLSFAREVCKDAALYFDPMNIVDIANKIELMVSDINLRKELINKGKEQLNFFHSPHVRAVKYLELCMKIITENRNGSN